MLLTEKIKVAVISNNNIVRISLIAVLEQFLDLEVVSKSADGETVVNFIDQMQPDVVLLNSTELTSTIDTALLIRQRHPEAQVIILSSFREYSLIDEAFKAGAINYVLNDITGLELAQAIRQAHIGKTKLTPEAVAALMSNTMYHRKKGINLSKQEREVLKLMVQGLKNKEIALKMDISRSTVKNHISSLFTKLHVDNRTKAVMMAIQLKLLEELDI